MLADPFVVATVLLLPDLCLLGTRTKKPAIRHENSHMQNRVATW
jgi:hypothetical protein